MTSKSLFLAVVVLVLSAAVAIYTAAVTRETQTHYDLRSLRSELREVASDVEGRLRRQDQANQEFLNRTQADLATARALADDLAGSIDAELGARTDPPEPESSPKPPRDRGNNGWGNGDQNAPGNSGGSNQAENRDD